jgi:predicted SAM-dependent methyltransferase
MQNLRKNLSQFLRDRYGGNWDRVKLQSQIVYGKISRQFFRPSMPSLSSQEVNLHLGCGEIDHPGFINIDGLPSSHIHYIRPINDLSPFQDESVSLIYASHCLEHFSHQEVLTVLKEWFRVLKINGVLRVSVPDFDLLLDIYQDNDLDLNTIIYPLMGSQINKYDFHMIAFNQSNLTELFNQAGFSKVRAWEPGLDSLTTLNDWSGRKILVNGKYYPVSLNIEAIK